MRPNLDDAITLEGIVNTDGMKLQSLEKPLIVQKEPGAVKVGDLLAGDEIEDSRKKGASCLM